MKSLFYLLIGNQKKRSTRQKDIETGKFLYTSSSTFKQIKQLPFASSGRWQLLANREARQLFGEDGRDLMVARYTARPKGG